jgi:hypothetical protein
MSVYRGPQATLAYRASKETSVKTAAKVIRVIRVLKELVCKVRRVSATKAIKVQLDFREIKDLLVLAHKVRRAIKEILAT